MCIGTIIGSVDEKLKEKLIQAQWNVMLAFRRAVDTDLDHHQAGQVVRNALARANALVPEQWADQVARALVSEIDRLQTEAQTYADEVKQLRQEGDDLQQALDRREENVSRQLARAHSKRCDQW